MNPATQLGSKDKGSVIGTLGTGTVLEKIVFNLSDNPLFREALILTILIKPSSVRCSFLFISSIIDLNRIKSALF